MNQKTPIESVAEWPREYVEFVRLFNGRQFYDAHEVLEDLWIVEVEPLKSFYKGLIQLAAALWHWEHGHNGSARRLLARSEYFLSRVPEQFEGLSLSGLRREASQVIDSAPDRLEGTPRISWPESILALELSHAKPPSAP